MALPISNTLDIFGIGLAYPFRLDSSNTRLLTASGEEAVKYSIEQIINTDVNERPFKVKDGAPFGTRVRRSLFEPPQVVIDIFKYDVPRALRVWEPRISVLEVEAYYDITQPTQVIGTVLFKYLATNREDNFVRPYRLQKPETER